MMLAAQSVEIRARGEAPILADKLPCESWNERMWADGGDQLSRRQQSIRQLTVAILGWKSSVHVAERQTTLIWRR